MRYVCAKSAISALTLIAATVISMLWSVTPLRAQGGLSDRDRNINDRTAEMSDLERRNARAKRDPQAILAEVNEDFNRLRAIDEEMKTGLASNSALDYKHVAVSSAEVKQRATRLKTNLTLPEPKGEKRAKVEEPGADLKPALTTLESFLNSFLTNPIFSDSGDLDARLAGKAKLDLDSILELSEKVRKSAEKISKNADKR